MTLIIICNYFYNRLYMIYEYINILILEHNSFFVYNFKCLPLIFPVSLHPINLHLFTVSGQSVSNLWVSAMYNLSDIHL